MTHYSRILIPLRWLLSPFLSLALAAGAYAQAPAKSPPAPMKQAVKGAQAVQAYAEFDKRLKDYEALQVKTEASLPKLSTKATAEEITAHKEALAQKLREARPNAKQGDIVVPSVSKRIRELFRAEFKGRARNSKMVRNSLREAEQVKDMRWHVGKAYPDKLPFETVPAGLLEKLPELPKDVQYRIVGHDLLLLDSVAGVVIDFIPDAKP